jgi:hypothetical protein
MAVSPVASWAGQSSRYSLVKGCVARAGVLDGSRVRGGGVYQQLAVALV